MRDDLQVTLYTRSGCHLCEDTELELSRLAEQLGFRVQLVDIALDAAAHDRWWADIPVVVVGSTTLKAPIHAAHLRSTLLAALREYA